ncbi:uncharacterized protein RJT21DRAFT_118915 [Scheffersomyces amazonensis]|uniref:uncharacterized protein n=1 Tax=Scheffersomyces amazonensis TaxID=1078765 RepID=UPI00315D7ECD
MSINNEDMNSLRVRISADVRAIVNGERSSNEESRKEELGHLGQLVDQADGLNADDVSDLLQAILNSGPSKSLSSSEKRYVIKHILIPHDTCELNIELIYSILGQIGINSGTSKKSKSISQTLQLLLLQWIVDNLESFGSHKYHQLYRMLPILFNYLSFEYSRPYIANFIYLTLTNHTPSFTSYFNKQVNINPPPVKRFYVQLVVDLYYRFPTDDYLKSLLILFHQLDASLDLGIDLSSLKNSSSFSYPSERDLISKDTNGRKRSRGNSQESIIYFDSKDEFNVSVHQINSLYDLIKHFHSLKYLDVRSMLVNTEPSPEKNYKMIFLVLQTILQADSSIIKKLDHTIRLIHLNESLDKISDNLEDLLQFAPGIIQLPSLTRIIQDSPDYIRFLPLLTHELPSDFKVKVLVPILEHNSGTAKGFESIVMFVKYFQNCFRHLQTSPDTHFNAKMKYYNEVNECVTALFQYLAKVPLCYEWCLAVISIVNFLKSIPLNDLNEFFEDSSVTIPPNIVHLALFYGDPYTFSEICGYIALTKNYHFKTENHKLLQNCYIMDIVNLVWRDKGFSHDIAPSSSNRACLLNPQLIQNFRFLPIFNTNPINLIGSLFFNPSWSYISSQIVWKLEDQNEFISARHQGPVTIESIRNLTEDDDNTWLNISYDDLKLHVLKQLDTLKFTGLCDLLFSSLKTLMQQRDTIART